jgi:hypothetical protein
MDEHDTFCLLLCPKATASVIDLRAKPKNMLRQSQFQELVTLQILYAMLYPLYPSSYGEEAAAAIASTQVEAHSSAP